MKKFKKCLTLGDYIIKAFIVENDNLVRSDLTIIDTLTGIMERFCITNDERSKQNLLKNNYLHKDIKLWLEQLENPDKELRKETINSCDNVLRFLKYNSKSITMYENIYNLTKSKLSNYS